MLDTYLFIRVGIKRVISALGDAWVVRGYLEIGNAFELRTEGLDFKLISTLAKFDETWGTNTFGALKKFEYDPNHFGAAGTFHHSDAICWMENFFMRKIENRFPTIRFHGNCVASRTGNSRRF